MEIIPKLQMPETIEDCQSLVREYAEMVDEKIERIAELEKERLKRIALMLTGCDRIAELESGLEMVLERLMSLLPEEVNDG